MKMAPTTRSKISPAPKGSTTRIPSLDGLRALSILMVVLSHTLGRLQINYPVNKYWATLCNGEIGVYIFFVISGFLITTLLLNEYGETDHISLGRFYLRRVLRIFPPLYFYLAFLTILSFLGLLHISGFDFAATALFFRNYLGRTQLWALDHTWSLSVEEQFYLIWPIVLLLCLRHTKQASGRIRAAQVALSVIVLCPLIRVISSVVGNEYFRRGNTWMFHSRADSLMFGCVIALLIGTNAFERLYQTLARVWWLFPLVLLFSAFLEVRYQNYWDFSMGYSLDGLCIAMFVLWCVRNPATRLGRLLNWAPIRRIGVLSYSIYIWQSFFLVGHNREVFSGDTIFNTLPTSWIFILLAAECSYRFVERPALRLRSRIEQKLRRSSDVNTAPASA